MRGIYLLLTLFILISTPTYSQECKSSLYKSAADRAADDWLGLKCDPLDKDTWPDQSWSSPCDCLRKGDKFSRIKDALFKKNREHREELIVDLLEKKVAETLKSQIDSGFEQALRLDALLKQGVFSEDSLMVKENFPESCRINKFKEQVISLKGINTCSPKIYNRRLKALLGDYKNIDEFIISKMEVLKKATMNELTPKDKQNGLCLPYKSFQSLNNSNPLRKTYLKIAAFKKNYSDFQRWAVDRSNPNDTSYLIGMAITKPKPVSFNKSGGFGLGMISLGPSLIDRKMAALDLETDMYSGVEPIDQDQIQHLLRTDPVFERMVKDPVFFNKIANGELGDADNFYENDKKVISALMQSQNTQCKSLYGESSRALLTKQVVDVDDEERGSQKSKKSQSPKSEPSKNILTQYLCDENFPRKFLNKETIKNFLAPEFKKAADIKGIKHTEAIIAKWGYCRGDDVKVSEDGLFEATLDLQAVPDSNLEAQPLSRLLNISLNPDSDLMSGKNNLYTKFNKEICPFVRPECVNPDPSFINFDCATSKIATDVSEKIIKTKLSPADAQALLTEFGNKANSDKKIRESLVNSGKFTEDQINAIITLRNQTPAARYARALGDMKRALNIPSDQSIEEYVAKNGGMEAVLKDPNISDDIRERIAGFRTEYRSDNIQGETTSAKNSSYFANYFALGATEDEAKIASFRSSDQSVNGRNLPDARARAQIDNGNSSGSSSSGTNTGSGPGFYERKSFDEPVVVIPPPGGNKGLVQENPVETKPPTTPVASLPPSKEPAAPIKSQVKEEKIEIPSNNTPSVPNSPIGNYSGFSLSSNSSSKKRPTDSQNGLSDLEDQRDDLENRINKLNDQLNNFDQSKNNSELADLKDQKRKLEGELNNMRNNNGNSSGRNSISNNGFKNNFSNDWNNSWNGSNSNSFNRPFNNGYNRGEEFLGEQSKNKLDDGSEAFDPENAKTAARSPESMGSGSAADKGKGGAGGGSVSLAQGAGGGDEDGSMPGLNSKSKRKNKRSPASNGDQELLAKCGTGPVVKCIFPNSYFSDDESKNRLYITIANLRLEGKKFQTLEKVRKSKKEMRPGESSKAKYYLYTYDVFFDNGKKQITDQEREELYTMMKEKRKDPTFRKKLMVIRYLTQAVPPKKLLTDNEAMDAINRTITPEEYEQLQLQGD